MSENIAKSFRERATFLSHTVDSLDYISIAHCMGLSSTIGVIGPRSAEFGRIT